jgi:hypothetical protein
MLLLMTVVMSHDSRGLDCTEIAEISTMFTLHIFVNIYMK